MCLFHDLGEARVSDLNYVHQMYVDKKERKAISDSIENLPFGKDVEIIVDEFEERQSLESIVAKDADNLEWILSLKEESDIGNKRADDWIFSAVKRLKTKSAQLIAKDVIKTDSNAWWFGDKEDSWWINRDKKKSNIKWNK
jgi:putative hydrolase of HD superfamily